MHEFSTFVSQDCSGGWGWGGIAGYRMKNFRENGVRGITIILQLN